MVHLRAVSPRKIKIKPRMKPLLVCFFPLVSLTRKMIRSQNIKQIAISPVVASFFNLSHVHLHVSFLRKVAQTSVECVFSVRFGGDPSHNSFSSFRAQEIMIIGPSVDGTRYRSAGCGE